MDCCRNTLLESTPAFARRSHEHWNAFCVRSGLPRSVDAPPKGSGPFASLSCSNGANLSASWRIFLRRAHVQFATRDVDSFLRLVGYRNVDLFRLQRSPQQTTTGDRRG